MSNLLPCPFCGGEAMLGETRVFTAGGIIMYEASAWCDDCLCTLREQDVDEEMVHKRIIEAWNTRAKSICTYEPILMYDEEGIEGYECDNCGNTIYASDGIPKVCPRCKMEVSNRE